MSREITILVNPAAGRGRAARAAGPVAAGLRAAGLPVREILVPDPAEALARLRSEVRSGTGAVVAVGGDGTVSLALQAVAGTGTPLGIVPIGSGNDFARTVGLPVGDLDAALPVITAGHTRDLDLGRVGERWFGTVIAAGFDSRVNERANAMRWPRGRMRYNRAVLAELGNLKPVPYELELDGRTLEVEAMLVAVGNGSSYGGGMKICPDARMDDGRFQITVVEACGRIELLRVLPRAYSGRHVEHPKVTTYEASVVSLAAPKVTAWADGERISALPVTATTERGALRLLAPPVAEIPAPAPEPEINVITSPDSAR
ncbi:diacylglycerol kinase [Yinghuangia seranimata]|uniref:diacylglycerol kinase n=1 Tax=Yinghuangia seranimata TaxID=408067 RepID=UPI00248B5356|nr:diacylglycerol kinase [Yinghuangia seranimata]MDI2126659.1 diacylglycerol kinase [Yinghuangia seranimata]